MRQTLTTVIIAVLLTATATVVDVIAAGVKTVAARNHFYHAAPANGVVVAVPSGMKSFPTELLPQ